MRRTIVLLVALAACVPEPLPSALLDVPQTDTHTIPELTSTVQVVRVEGDVPHIYAADRADLVRVLGFVEAQDRYFEMEMARRLGLGQLSELLGDAALQTDMESRGNGMTYIGDQMLARMDIISINCPHTPATYHLLSARRLALMKPSAYIVNTARGEVIDESALVRLLNDGEIAGAGLDVFEHEPAVSPKLVRLARAGKVVLLPHMGSATVEGRVDMGERVIVNIKTFLDGHKPPDRVLPSML